MRRLFVLMAAAGILAMLLGGCSKDDAGTAGKKDNGQTADSKMEMGNFVALVNGEGIAEKALEKEVNRMTQQVAGRVDPSQLPSLRRRYRQQAIGHLINRTLLLAEADKAGITATKEEVYTRLSTIMEGFESEEAFNNRLRELNMTRKDLQDELAVGIKIELFIDTKIPMDHPIDEAELKTVYENNKQRFTHDERVRASHILITVNQNDSDEVKAEKKSRMERILVDIMGGADFAQLAAEHSECPSRNMEGDLGYFERGRMVPEFEEVAFSLGVGEVSNIVETQFGYHIIKVTDHQEARTIPFDEAREELEREYNRMKREELIGNYIDGLRADAVIEYADSSLMQNE